jgi:threonine synthase
VTTADTASAPTAGRQGDPMLVVDDISVYYGNIAAVSDAEIIEGIKLLAETEGVFTETAGGTTIAVLKKLVEQGKINPSETTVAYITGNGLKTTEAVADVIGKPYTIEANLDSFKAAWQQAQTA